MLDLKNIDGSRMSFRKLNGPNLVEKVAEGKRYENEGNQDRRLIFFLPTYDIASSSTRFEAKIAQPLL
jgi:hypothetical protein